MIRGLLRLVAFGLLVGLASCGKVRLIDLGAEFVQADAAYFVQEDTLFVFYEVTAQEGFNPATVVELSYTVPGPSGRDVDWTPIEEFDPVHTHLPVDCGRLTLCGSWSISVPDPPDSIGLRVRYHPDDEPQFRDRAELVYNVVADGRSLVVYGAFDETNRFVQWRGRHQFPTVRNERATELGLRRDFTVRNQRYGDVGLFPVGNPYGYGIPCAADLSELDFPDVTTNQRARFNAEPIPPAAGDADMVCGEASVRDGTVAGSFTTSAYARKNPRVRAAFPELRTPIREATPLNFFLGSCVEPTSAIHVEMQRQRLLMGDVQTTCIENQAVDALVGELTVAFREAIEAARPAGNDMVLVIGINSLELTTGTAVQQALAEVLPFDQGRSSPRLTGALVFDTQSRAITTPGIARSTLWCPSRQSPGGGIDPSFVSCPTIPFEQLNLGPLSIASLPILPSIGQYESFVRDFSERQAGAVDTLTFRAPEFATTSDHVELGEFGVATFLNGEAISAEPDDAFSYCAPETFQPFVARSELMQNPGLIALLYDACFQPPTDSGTPYPKDSGTPYTKDSGYASFQIPGLPTLPNIPGEPTGYLPSADLCSALINGLVPLEVLPEWHRNFGEARYELGLFWEFPYLLELDYQGVVAGSLQAFGLNVPFGFRNPQEQLLGSQIWTQESFPLFPTLSQCTAFCDHPTFDGAGVYSVLQTFRNSYERGCYVPRFPTLVDTGFPLDP